MATVSSVENGRISGQDDLVPHIALFHSVYGLRPAVLVAAEMLRAAGHRVVTPDLYAGQVATSIDEGFALSDRVGWTTIMHRARQATRDLPPDAVLAGLSMGAGVAGDLLADRRETAGVLLLHGTGGDPSLARAGMPVQLHIADPDELFPPAQVAEWSTAMRAAGAVVEAHAYPGVGHFFTDPDTPDHNAAAAALAWRRARHFLDGL